MNILLVEPNILLENFKFYYFKDIKKETYTLIKKLNSSDYTIRWEAIEKIKETIREKIECKEVLSPIKGKNIDIIWGMYLT